MRIGMNGSYPADMTSNQNGEFSSFIFDQHTSPILLSTPRAWVYGCLLKFYDVFLYIDGAANQPISSGLCYTYFFWNEANVLIGWNLIDESKVVSDSSNIGIFEWMLNNEHKYFPQKS